MFSYCYNKNQFTKIKKVWVFSPEGFNKKHTSPSDAVFPVGREGGTPLKKLMRVLSRGGGGQ